MTKKGITVTVQNVTPEMAERWLTGNTHNRRMKSSAVDKYASDMVAGCWDLNGESLKFNGDGRLLDGQNRLQAVIQSGATIRTLVVSGIDAGAQETVDVGVPRRLADVLTLRGEVSTVDLAAGLVRLWQYRRNPQSVGLSIGPTVHAAIALLEHNPAIRESVRVADRARRAVGLRASVGVALHFVLSSIDQEDADVFFERLGSGVGLGEDDPILRLRNLVIDGRTSSRFRRRTRAHDWALCVKAWNAYRDGRQVKLLAWRPGGANPESFPVPV